MHTDRIPLGIQMASVSKTEFEKTVIALDGAFLETSKFPTDSKHYKLLRDATIHRFEYCIELAWKTSMKTLGHGITSPKPALREMLRSDLIRDFDLWFGFIHSRNLSSHSYDKTIATQVFAVIGPFISEAKDLLLKL